MTNTQIERGLAKLDALHTDYKDAIQHDETILLSTAFCLWRSILEAMKDPEDKTWKCPHCGKAEGTWFDRTLDDKGNMTTRCISCGKDIDDKPIAPEKKPHAHEWIFSHSLATEDMYTCKCGMAMLKRKPTCDPKDVITIDRKVAEELVSWYPENCKNALQAIVDAVRRALNKDQQTTN